MFSQDVMKYIWVPDVYIDGIQELRSPAYKVKTFALTQCIDHPDNNFVISTIWANVLIIAITGVLTSIQH